MVFPQAGLCATEWYKDSAAAVVKAREGRSCLKARSDDTKTSKTSKNRCCLPLGAVLHVPVRGCVQKIRDFQIYICPQTCYVFHSPVIPSLFKAKKFSTAF